MFPFIIKGRVPLGLRRDYHLSEAGLTERIAERLVKGARRPEMRTDGSYSGDGRGLLAGGLSRLLSMGFLNAVRVRKISIISRGDFLFARYEMDAIASTLVCMVIIPLVLGSILFSHPAFGFYESLAILILLVITSWGLDVFVLVMMLRHEIYQIASEIRAIMRRQDTMKIDPHHEDLSPEDLLATAYYYERNGLFRRCEAYLAHLTACHPDSLEAALAHEHLDHLGGIPRRHIFVVRNEGGSAKGSPSTKVRWFRAKGDKACPEARKDKRKDAGDEEKGPAAAGKGRRIRWKIPGLLSRKGRAGKLPEKGGDSLPKARRTDYREQKKRGYGSTRRRTAQERVIRKRQERLERREAFVDSPDERNQPFFTRMKNRALRLIHWETREERRYRSEQRRWLHGPRPTRAPERSNGNSGDSRFNRPNWMRSRDKKQAFERQRRWSEGFTGPGSTQKSRDRWGRWRLLREESKQGRMMSDHPSWPED